MASFTWKHHNNWQKSKNNYPSLMLNTGVVTVGNYLENFSQFEFATIRTDSFVFSLRSIWSFDLSLHSKSNKAGYENFDLLMFKSDWPSPHNNLWPSVIFKLGCGYNFLKIIPKLFHIIWKLEIMRIHSHRIIKFAAFCFS